MLRLRLPATSPLPSTPVQNRDHSPEFRTRFHRKQERSFRAWPRRSSAPDRRQPSAPNAHHKTAIYNTLRPARSIAEPVSSVQWLVASRNPAILSFRPEPERRRFSTLVIPTGAGAPATAERRNLLSLPPERDHVEQTLCPLLLTLILTLTSWSQKRGIFVSPRTPAQPWKSGA